MLQNTQMNRVAHFETVDSYAIVLERSMGSAGDENFRRMSEFSKSASNAISIARQTTGVFAVGDILDRNQGYPHVKTDSAATIPPE
jgi:hypothetical protein